MPQTGIIAATIFANESGNQPASQLDTVFAQGISALNNLSTFGNYYVDTGTGGAIAITVPTPLVATIAAGLPFQIKVAAANSGSTTIAVNGGGGVNLVYPNINGLLANQLSIGALISVMHDGTRFQYLGSVYGNGGGGVTMTLTGCTTSPTGTLMWNVSNNMACVEIPSITGTSNSTAMTMTGLPVYLQPARQQNMPVPDFYAEDNSVPIGGLHSTGASVQFNPSSGAVTFLKNGSNNDWTSGNIKGTGSTFTVAYNLT